MGKGASPSNISNVQLSFEGHGYAAQLWRHAEGRWALVEVSFEDGSARKGSGADGSCLDVMFEAEALAEQYFSSKTEGR